MCVLTKHHIHTRHKTLLDYKTLVQSTKCDLIALLDELTEKEVIARNQTIVRPAGATLLHSYTSRSFLSFFPSFLILMMNEAIPPAPGPLPPTDGELRLGHLSHHRRHPHLAGTEPPTPAAAGWLFERPIRWPDRYARSLLMALTCGALRLCGLLFSMAPAASFSWESFVF